MVRPQEELSTAVAPDPPALGQFSHKVNLIGTTSNRSGLGAMVKVQVGTQTYTKVHDGQSGYLSQSLYPLYFGLGNAEVVDQIAVRWPSGREQIVAGPIATNSLVEVREL